MWFLATCTHQSTALNLYWRWFIFFGWLFCQVAIGLFSFATLYFYWRLHLCNQSNKPSCSCVWNFINKLYFLGFFLLQRSKAIASVVNGHVHPSVRLIWQPNCWGQEYPIPEKLCFVFVFVLYWYLYVHSELISQVFLTRQPGSGGSYRRKNEPAFCHQLLNSS